MAIKNLEWLEKYRLFEEMKTKESYENIVSYIEDIIVNNSEASNKKTFEIGGLRLTLSDLEAVLKDEDLLMAAASEAKSDLENSEDFIQLRDRYAENALEYVYSTAHPDKPWFVRTLDGCLKASNSWLQVVIENLDEGISGDYNPEDPDDINLLRFSVYVLRTHHWEAVDDASYCTNLAADTDPKILERAAALLFKEYYNALNSDRAVSVKKLGEQLSHISADWFGSDAP